MDTAALDQLYLQHLQTLMMRADRALEAAGYDALAVHSGSRPTQFLDDQDYPYKVNPHFKAWVPIVDNPGSVLLYRPGKRPKVLFHRPGDFWHLTPELPEADWAKSLEVVSLDAADHAAQHWADVGRVAFIGPKDAFGDVDAASVNAADLLTRLHYDRAVKTAYELECMRRASALAVKGHRAAAAAFRSGVSEYQVQMRYLEACMQREEEMPYNNIVAYNEHAAILHYQHLDRRPPPEIRSFLLDAGAQYRGYAADVTRTHAAGTGRFADLLAAVDRAQRRLCDEIVPGRDYRDVHLSAHRLLGDVLHEHDIVTVPGHEAVERGLTSVFFPHGIGHLLGLQVHDVGGVMGDPQGGRRERPEGHPYLRLTRMLEPGVVVTIEPGLYFIDSLLEAAKAGAKAPFIDWKLVDELKPFGGIRIEDNVVATATTPENMTRDAFANEPA